MRRLFPLVAAVVLVDTMFFAAVAPLLPHYSDELDLSKSAAGVLAAAYPAGTLVGALPSGWLAARVGVKPTVLIGLTLLAVTSLVFGFANNVVDARRGALRAGARRRVLVGGRPRLARVRLAGRQARHRDRLGARGRDRGRAPGAGARRPRHAAQPGGRVQRRGRRGRRPGRVGLDAARSADRAERGDARRRAGAQAPGGDRGVLAVHAARRSSAGRSRCWARSGWTSSARPAPRSA